MEIERGGKLINAHNDVLGGSLLVGATVLGLAWANSPWAHGYETLWHIPLSISFGDLVLERSLLHWINDGLMAMFFFVAGLEIKREFLVGELSSLRAASLPVLCAVGGMLIPALCYVATVMTMDGTERVVGGWGIPMATDIAFALGLFAIVSRKAPPALRIFLLSLAIVDDLGAVLVIALFYTSDLSIMSLSAGGGFLAALIVANLAGIRHILVYGALGIGGLWIAFLISGVHPTVAGVLAAFAIPARPHLDRQEFVRRGAHLLTTFHKAGQVEDSPLANPTQADAARSLERVSDLAQTPLQRLEHALRPWTLLVIMPLFALSNAGVSFEPGTLKALSSAVPLAILAGLVIGKPFGIAVTAWLAVRSGVTSLPENVSFSQIHAVAWLGGIGFTMSLFIANLAFGTSEHLANAKVAVLMGSTLCAVLGSALLRRNSTGSSV
ncbi:MAG: Na+/H+ antiporter NhaA [Nitrospira sp. WS238]|nr:Na+/H+ antiporter NhaA [Nitrospira sp. WS238]